MEQRNSSAGLEAPLLSIGLLAAAALGYEVLLMRLFSIIQWHHFAYMMISLALLGYGASGTFLSLAQRWLQRGFLPAFTTSTALFGVSAVACFLIAQQVAFNPLEVLWDPRQFLRLMVIYLLLSIPFFAAAVAIGLSLQRFSLHVHRIYSADLLGAGLGSLGIVLWLFVLTPTQALLALGAVGIVAAALASWQAGGRLPAVLLALVPTLFLLLPDRWLALNPSPYKGLSQTLQVTGTRVLEERTSPLGLITVVESPVIPFREAPGLSLNATTEPPPQLGLFTDGEGLSVITRYEGQREPLAYLDFLTSALPYHLLQYPPVLVVGAGGGADVLQALYHGASHIDAVELNPQVVDLVRRTYADFAGQLYTLPRVQAHVAEARGFMAGTEIRWDLIQVALFDSFGAAAGGLYALSESYLYTVEAFQDYLQHLNPGGLLAITRWVKLPPRDALKLFATAVTALERSGVSEPGRQLALVRGWKTATLLLKNGPLTAADIAAIKAFCQARSFDLGYYPGIAPDEANRYNLLERPYFYEGAQALLGDRRDEFLSRYKFHIAPATDDRPYFFHFFKWRVLPEILAHRGQGGFAVLESGYLILAATLVQALLASLLLILLPLGMVRRRRAEAEGRVSWLRVLVYFLALGLAFLFIEIAFIQKFTLFLSHPLYAVAVVLSAFLVFAGLGSRYSAGLTGARLTNPVLWVAAGITLIAALYLLFLPDLFHRLMPLPDALKVLVSVALIAPLAFLMGMPFPAGLATLGLHAPHLIPWAWGINGCASVVSAVLATLLAVHLGFTAVVLLATLLYLGAAFSAPQKVP
jgi:spermidine synthase